MAEMRYNVPDNQWPDHPERVTMEGKNKFIGFWVFLCGETVLFASLFATYLALENSVPSDDHLLTHELFQLELAFVMTMFLLTSSLTSVYAVYHMRNNNFKQMQIWLAITVLLGAGFLALEIYEFSHFVDLGHTFRSSAFASSFYFLLGTHGFHVAIGLVWITLLILRNARRGLSVYTAAKVNTAALYWHFIDVVWVFIFSIVYLLGVI